METTEKKTIYSAVQPSGNLTIGNYAGAIRNWVAMQDEYECYYAIANMHAITVRQEPAELRRRTLELAALYLACGIDPNKCALYVQSQVPQHAELAWVLNCSTYVGEMQRMTQFKDKSQKHADNINMGLMDYPVLMAADILLYQSHCVPVGADQKQHVEIARDIAIRFNNRYGETFRVPEPVFMKSGAKIMSLQEPTKKMSKSDENPNGYILLLDKPEDIMRKFKRAVTDSDNRIIRAEGKDGITNLITIYAAATGKTPEEVEAEFAGQGYGAFKPAVGEAVAELLRPVRETTEDLLKNKDYLEQIYKEGAEQANYIAQKTLDKVYRKIGFVKR